jgi:glycosyltransferase involved in cell wall biosynthesis
MPGGTAPEGTPRVAIAMATLDPDPELFGRQVDSIREQELSDWVCIVSDDQSTPAAMAAMQEAIGDDARFAFVPSERRRGAYRNFERALQRVPGSVPYVALADQDDRWHPEKLETLVGELGDANLVYSDARIVDRDGAVLAPTYWTRRRNNHTNLASLLIANTVSGGATLFRRDVLELALPFPDPPGEQYHDHWLALVALATGRIAYVDRPLYDYVQHPRAALGHVGANLPPRERRRIEPRDRHRADSDPDRGPRSAYLLVYSRLRVLSEVLIERAGARLTPPAHRTLTRFVRAERSPAAFLWLLVRPARRLAGRNETMGAEAILVRGLLWRYLTRARALVGGRA